jgi:hypothetical protein
MPGAHLHRSWRDAEGNKEMNCCAEANLALIGPLTADPQRACESCHGPSHSVTPRTMLLMLRPELFSKVGQQQYRFCASPECPVIYFSEGGHFITRDVRIRIGIKETEDPIPLCYCFGFYEQDLRDEITIVGHTTIPQRISVLIKERMCACEERNPSGNCCLREVLQAAKRLTKEAK